MREGREESFDRVVHSRSRQRMNFVLQRRVSRDESRSQVKRFKQAGSYHPAPGDEIPLWYG